MTFLKAPGAKAQVSLEALVTMSFALPLALATFALLFHCLGCLLLTKWAAENSQCVARQEPAARCQEETARLVHEHFAIQHVVVKSIVRGGIIRSSIDGLIAGSVPVSASYDLTPSEYKRVSR